MFEHSVKVPRHYKVVANIIKKVSTEGGSVKTLLYDNKLRHYKTDVLYALITETIKHANELDKIFEECNLLKSEPRLDPWLAKVLATELLYGKKTLPGKSKPEKTILSYKDQFETYATDKQTALKTEDIRRPRYVRINTNLLTTSDAIGAFQDEGYRFIRCTSGSYDDYLKQIQGLTEYDFTQDYHVKTVFVFAPGTKLHNHDLYLENKIILQDKATAMAVHLLAPPPGSVVMDMCAAPGNKTTQLAAFMRNQGKIYAIERNEQRYKTLCDFVEKTGSTCVQTLHKDSLEIKRGDYDDVEYILLDPSCSGSGMTLSVHNYIDENRLAKLTSLQEKFLKHAMNAFPNAKKIVYSTCSLFPEENERVITNVVKLSRSKWRVQDVKEQLKGQWNNIGSGMYGSIGTRCLYARPDSDLTTGFFLAVLERDKKDLEKSQNYNAVKKENDETNTNESEEFVNTHKEHYKIKLESDVNGFNNIEESGEEFVERKKKNYNAIKKENDETNNNDSVEFVYTHEEHYKIKLESDVNGFNNIEENGKEFVERKKKKKKHKKKEASQNGDVDIELKADALISEATEECSEEVTENKKKTKHNKKETSENQDLSVESKADITKPEAAVEERFNNIEENDEEFVERKKKKKKHKKQEASQIGDVDIGLKAEALISEATEECSKEVTEKKKKKKHKKKEMSENQDLSVESKADVTKPEAAVEENSEEIIETKKKKNHKTKVKQENVFIESLESSILEVENDESNINNKKNKKRKKMEVSVNNLCDEVTNEIMFDTPKKKKTAELETSENIDIIKGNEMSQSDINEIPKKKKKKDMTCTKIHITLYHV